MKFSSFSMFLPVCFFVSTAKTASTIADRTERIHINQRWIFAVKSRDRKCFKNSLLNPSMGPFVATKYSAIMVLTIKSTAASQKGPLFLELKGSQHSIRSSAYLFVCSSIPAKAIMLTNKENMASRSSVSRIIKVLLCSDIGTVAGSVMLPQLYCRVCSKYLAI